MILNNLQRAITKNYIEGEHSHVGSIAEANKCGDGLLKFLLAEAGDAHDINEFMGMLESARNQLDVLGVELENAIIEPDVAGLALAEAVVIDGNEIKKADIQSLQKMHEFAELFEGEFNKLSGGCQKVLYDMHSQNTWLGHIARHGVQNTGEAVESIQKELLVNKLDALGLDAKAQKVVNFNKDKCSGIVLDADLNSGIMILSAGRGGWSMHQMEHLDINPVSGKAITVEYANGRGVVDVKDRAVSQDKVIGGR